MRGSTCSLKARRTPQKVSFQSAALRGSLCPLDTAEVHFEPGLAHSWSATSCTARGSWTVTAEFVKAVKVMVAHAYNTPGIRMPLIQQLRPGHQVLLAYGGAAVSTATSTSHRSNIEISLVPSRKVGSSCARSCPPRRCKHEVGSQDGRTLPARPPALRQRIYFAITRRCAEKVETRRAGHVPGPSKFVLTMANPCPALTRWSDRSSLAPGPVRLRAPCSSRCGLLRSCRTIPECGPAFATLTHLAASNLVGLNWGGYCS